MRIASETLQICAGKLRIRMDTVYQKCVPERVEKRYGSPWEHCLIYKVMPSHVRMINRPIPEWLQPRRGFPTKRIPHCRSQNRRRRSFRTLKLKKGRNSEDHCRASEADQSRFCGLLFAIDCCICYWEIRVLLRVIRSLLGWRRAHGRRYDDGWPCWFTCENVTSIEGTSTALMEHQLKDNDYFT
ncbi:hypothetical protein NDU88_005648 [Pleurodeles waltl]|uniref:Uncharacterized protein n=1 Tax=Pleurodeles waltl TaxID=8319 RepID=A0AAV7N500_PLEWA|nr:hypothetical protein NDU88_005648 [Pleurodeles waltl]